MKLILSYAYFNFKFFRLIIIIISSEYKTAQNPVNKLVFFHEVVHLLFYFYMSININC